MTLRVLGRAGTALLIPLIFGGLAAAGDGPAYPGAGAAVAGSPVGCLTCGKVKSEVGSECPTCVNGRFGIGWRKRPTVPSLAPGACFGYFPTQWNKWQDVCPIPYPGNGVTDPPAAGRRTAQPAKLPTDPKAGPADPMSDAPLPDAGKDKGGELPKVDPKPLDPKGGELPKLDPKPADPKGKGGELPKFDPKPVDTLKPADKPGAGSLPVPNIPPMPNAPPPPGKFNP